MFFSEVSFLPLPGASASAKLLEGSSLARGCCCSKWLEFLLVDQAVEWIE
jgi:hypothetical protein